MQAHGLHMNGKGWWGLSATSPEAKLEDVEEELAAS